MNVEMIKNGLTQKFGRTGLQLQKYSPEILLGAGLVGVVATVVLASKATLKAQAIVDDAHNTLLTLDQYGKQGYIRTGETDADAAEYTLKDSQNDKAIVYVQTGLKFAKLYAPAIGIGVLSLAAILGSHGIMVRRQVSLAAAYTLLSEGYKRYRARVVEELGADVDQDFHLGVRDETHTETAIDEDGKKVKTKVKSKGTISHKVASVYSRFFDDTNPNYRSDRTMNKAFLVAQQNYANDVLVIRGHVFLNEVYERLGFPHTKEGALVGWVLRSPDQMKAEGRAGYVDFGIYDVDDNPGREFVNGTNPSILLDFNVDGIIFDLI